jgi:hypothetical protein
MFFSSMDSMCRIFMESAKNVTPIQRYVPANVFSGFSQTSKTNDLLFRKSLRNLVTCAFSSQNSIELNYIEFFWGAVKQYLCEHCDCTFDMLKT